MFTSRQPHKPTYINRGLCSSVSPNYKHVYFSFHSNMAPPSKLAIATGVVTRLVKEEASYHKEIEQQEARIKKAKTNEGDDNAEYTLRQEVCVATKKVI
jgi:hypothetical protein